MRGPGSGRTLFKENVTKSTTLMDLQKWIKRRVPSNNQEVEIDAYMGDHGVVFNLGDERWSHLKVMDFLCYDQPLPVCVRERKRCGFIMVDTMMGTTIRFPYSNSMSVAKLKAAVEAKEGIPVREQRIFFDGKPLVAGSLEDNCVASGSKVDLGLALEGGGGDILMDFADVTKDDVKNTKWNKSAAKWRIARPGLCLEGICKNRKCNAYEQMVVMNFDYDNIDLIGDPKILDRCKCPICKGRVTPLAPAFNNCFYRIAARKTDSTALFQKPWTRCDDSYYTYDIKECGESSFDHLQIFVRPLDKGESKRDTPIPDDCAICFDRIKKLFVQRKDVSKLSSCGHYFHRSCVDLWSSVGGNCPCCRIPMVA